MEKKAINGKTWMIIGAVVVLLAVLGVAGYIISRGNTDREESLLELGQRYLDELNYEQAIVCFEEYLEIDPKCVEAYAGLAQAYVGLGEYEKALEVLADGYAATGEGSLLEMSSRIEIQYNEILIAETNEEEMTSEEDPTEETDAVEDTPEPEEEFVGPLVLDASTVDIIGGNGGVIVTVEGGSYGAINYQKKELVPHTYNGCALYPTDEGYFALTNSSGVHVFDAEGQKILQISGNYGSLFVSEGVVIYTANRAVIMYDIETGETNRLDAEYVYRPLTSTQLQDGKFYVWCYDYGDEEYEGFWSVNRDGNVQVNKDTTWGFLDYVNLPNDFDGMRILAQSDGYIPLVGGVYSFVFGLIDADSGKTVWTESYITFDEYYEDEDYADYAELSGDYTPDTAFSASYIEDTYINGYFRDGLLCFSKGKQMVYGDSQKGICYLLDFSNAKTTSARKGSNRPAGRVTNLQKLILAEYNYIRLSDSGYYQAFDGENWFYLDESGKKVEQSFLNCGAFYNGYAVVLDVDGMAYLIDTGFNKVSEGYPADRVYTAEAIYCIVSGNQVTILTAPEE